MIDPEKILTNFGVKGVCALLGSGHIHKTFKVTGEKNFVLQRVNKNVFTQPEVIASNNRIAFRFLKQHHPDYLFPQTLSDKKGNDLHYDDEGYPWRLFPMIDNTFSIDEVTSEQEAFDAAKGFGSLTKNLDGIDDSLFKPTFERFHDLACLYEQFENALQKAEPKVILQAQQEIDQAKAFSFLVEEYNQLI